MEKKYRAIRNDTFDTVAFRVYGNEHLCAMLMAANPDYMDVLLFEPGIELNIPDYDAKPSANKDLPPWYGD